MIKKQIEITPEQERLLNLGRSISVFMSPAPRENTPVNLVGNEKYVGYVDSFTQTEKGMFCNISL